jgi:Skp family chaperone for outer membrane proteins
MTYRLNRSGKLVKSLLPLLVGLAIAAAAGAARADTAPAFGSIDLGKVQSGYTKRGDLEKSIQDLADRLQAAMKVQSTSDMLNLAQQKQLGDLLSKPNQSDADRAAETTLQNQSRADASELATLQQKQNLTDTERARLDVLTKEQQAGKTAIDQINSDYTDQLHQQQDKVSTQFTDLVRQAIAAVAKDKGLAVVFDSSVAVYTANDITDDVLKRLNK